MQRRQFLESAILLGGAALLPSIALGSRARGWVVGALPGERFSVWRDRPQYQAGFGEFELWQGLRMVVGRGVPQEVEFLTAPRWEPYAMTVFGRRAEFVSCLGSWLPDQGSTEAAVYSHGGVSFQSDAQPIHHVRFV